MKRKRTILLIAGVAGILLTLFRTFLVFGQSTNETLPESVISIQLDESTVYLIPMDNGYLLFDTGYPWDFATFTSSIGNHGISISAIRYIFISHAHDDHAGFLNQIVQANPEVQVIAHDRTATLLAQGENNKKNGGGLFNRWVYLAFRVKQLVKPRWTLTYPPYEMRDTDIVLSHNEVDLSEALGIPATVIYTPGHTSDSFSLLYQGTHLFCGDFASTSFNWIGGQYLTVFNENIEELYASWSRIISRDVPVTVPSHGRPFPTKVLAEHIAAIVQEDLVRFF